MDRHRRHQSLKLAGRLIAALALVLTLACAANAAKPMVSANNHDTFVLNADGSVQVTGYNNYGMLGNDTTADIHGFTAPSGFSDVIQVAAGYYHSALLKADGKVWITGRNTYGQVGDNDTLNLTEVHVPTQTPNFTDVKQVAVGGFHTLALKADGTVYAWGFGGDGQLGNSSLAQKHAPYPVVSTLTGIKQIGAGWRFSAALKSDGTVWTWGKNDFGQLGDSSVAVGSYSSTPVLASGLTGVKQISVGYYHVLALKADGTVVSWGYNHSGQLGDNKNSGEYSNVPVAVAGLTGVKKVAAGGWHSLALRDNGALKSWGYNNRYQLGDGTLTNRNTPVDVTVTDADGVVDVAGGSDHTAFLRANGQIYTFGSNQNGELGDGSYGGWSSTSLNPTDVNPGTAMYTVSVSNAWKHTASLNSEGYVYSWGTNFYGVIGNGSNDPIIFGPTLASGLSSVIQVTAGPRDTLALKSDGTVWGWGENLYGEAGDGAGVRYSPVQASALTGVIKVALGEYTSYALKSDGSVWAWGSNGSGEFGDGTTNHSLIPKRANLTDVIDVAAGENAGFALKANGEVWAWGYNYRGQLGDWTQMGDGTPPNWAPVKLASLDGVNIIQLASTWRYHSAALTADGTVYGWGANTLGELGNGTTADSPNPVLASGLNNVVSISVGYGFSSALKSDGKLWGWGTAGSTVLLCEGYGTVTTPVEGIGLSNLVSSTAGSATAFAIQADGTLKGWGANGWGELGTGNNNSSSNHPVTITY